LSGPATARVSLGSTTVTFARLRASGVLGVTSELEATIRHDCSPPCKASATSVSSTTRWPGLIRSMVCSKRFWSFGSPDSCRRPGLSLACTVTFRAGPSPGFDTAILNCAGCPRSTLAEMAVCSTLSLGSRTIVRDLPPAIMVTVAAWSKAPARVGLTVRVIVRSDPAAIVPRLQVKSASIRWASGWLET